VVIVEVEGSVL